MHKPNFDDEIPEKKKNVFLICKSIKSIRIIQIFKQRAHPRLIGAKRKSFAFEIAITWHPCNEIYRPNTYFGAQESVEFDLEGFECARTR